MGMETGMRLAAHTIARCIAQTCESRSRSDQTERALARARFGAWVGVLAILLVSIHVGATGGPGFRWTSFASAIGTGILAGSSALLVGALVGFLFAVPRSQGIDRPPTQAAAAPLPSTPTTAPAPPPPPLPVQPLATPAATSEQGTPPSTAAGPAYSHRGAPVSGAYGPNSNLIEISDWLTKIIVGIGLTQYNEIASRFDNAAAVVAASMNGGGPTPLPMGLGAALLIHFALCGFFSSFIWTKRYLQAEYEKAERDAGQARTPFDRKLEQIGKGEPIRRRGKAPLDIASFERDIARAHVGLARELPAPTPSGATDPNDPWKGQFGGLARSTARALDARVSRIEGSAEYFDIVLMVRSLDRSAPLTGTVTFFLHPDFDTYIVPVSVDTRGVAQLSATSWGAFTAGALLDDGKTRLELDLATLPDVPVEFRT